VDQTGSEDSKQPAEKSAAPSEPAADEPSAGAGPSQPEDAPESARRAFDLLERFSGELEEILRSLERTKSAPPVAPSPPPPERAYRPSSIHFDSSPISTRIDPYALPQVETPGASGRPVTRVLLEVLFLVIVAAISAKTGLRPLLLIAAEAVALLIVVSIELGVAQERRRIRRLPAAGPSIAATGTEVATIAPAVTSITLDQVEPLVWRTDLQEAEADWPLAAFELASEEEPGGESPEPENPAALDLTLETRPSADRENPEPVPEAIDEASPEPESQLEVEPEVEPVEESQTDSLDEAAEEVEPAQPRRFHLFKREASEPEAEPDAEPEPRLEAEPEPEPAAESAEAEPGHRGRFHLFRHEAAEPEGDEEPEVDRDTGRDVEANAEPEPLLAVEPEVEPAGESPTSLDEAEEEVEPPQPRRFHLFRHEADENEAEVEAEVEPEPQLEPEPDVAAMSDAPAPLEAASEEAATEEDEPERKQRFHLFRREADENEATAEAEIEPEIEAAELEPAAEWPAPVEAAVEEDEPEHRRRFHLRHEEREPEPEFEAQDESESEPLLEAEPEIETGADSVGEIEEATAESPAPPDGAEEEAEHTRRFHLFRHEENEPEVEGELAEAEAEPEIAAEAEPEHTRRFHLFRHEESEPEVEVEPEAEPQLVEPVVEPAAKSPASIESAPEEVAAEEAEPAQPQRYRLFGREAGEPERAAEPAEQPGELPEVAPEERLPARSRRLRRFREEQPATEQEVAAFKRDKSTELEAVEGFPLPTESAEMEVEVDLPPEIAIEAIELTLEDLGRGEPRMRRRRWPLRAESVPEVAAKQPEFEVVDGESELRLAAERERRQREREYLRSLRSSR